ncbi:MAG: tail fiber domain-containing protein [Spirochaetes bacterium]|jgi:hypothetical protein|nr:tail fiber domain-containing protein [Spirochaetota bacterium]
MRFELSNTRKSGEINSGFEDCKGDYYLPEDNNRDFEYHKKRLAEAFRVLSSSKKKAQVLTEGRVSAGSLPNTVNIPEIYCIGRDENDNDSFFYIPEMTDIPLPSGWNDGRQIWIQAVHRYSYSDKTRLHRASPISYHHVLKDGYVGDDNSNDLFVDSEPSEETAVIDSFNIDNSGVLTLMSGQSEVLAIDKASQLYVHGENATLSFDPVSEYWRGGKAGNIRSLLYASGNQVYSGNLTISNNLFVEESARIKGSLYFGETESNYIRTENNELQLRSEDAIRFMIGGANTRLVINADGSISGIKAGDVPNLPADKITSGTMSGTRISGGTPTVCSINGADGRMEMRIDGVTVASTDSAGLELHGNYIQGVERIKMTGGTSAIYFSPNDTGTFDCLGYNDIYNEYRFFADGLESLAKVWGGQFIEMSSKQYKKDIEDVEDQYSSIIYKMRPIWYRNKYTKEGKPELSHYGFVAEELADLDPRYVGFGLNEEENKLVEVGKKKIEDCTIVPKGINYSRLIVPVIAEMQKHEDKINSLFERVDKLEKKK